MRTLILALLIFASSSIGELELTVYNKNLALVKESRVLEIEKGVSEVSLPGVPARILPETVHFHSPSGELRVLEQNFRYDLLHRESLLERYRGKEVRALIEGKWETVRLLAHGSPSNTGSPLGRILEVNGEIHVEDLILPELPEGLLLEPSLLCLLESRRGGKHDIELSYLSEGLEWKADYVAVVSPENRIDLQGWVTLNNQSGRDYLDAGLKLVAGDVNRVQSRIYPRGEKLAIGFDASRHGFSEESFFEYHLYTLGRRTNLLDREQKQVELLESRDIPGERDYLLRSNYGQMDTEARSLDVTLSFPNRKGEGPGLPLPGGIVRVYQEDRSGQLQFAGEDRISHTPEGESIRLKVGQSFDLRGEHRVLETDRQLRGKIIVSTIQILLRNHKDEKVTMTVLEGMPGWKEWKILSTSHEGEKESANTWKYEVEVPAKGEVVIDYRLRIS